MMQGEPKSRNLSAYSGVFEKKWADLTGEVGNRRYRAVLTSAMSRKRAKRGLGWILSTGSTMNPKWGVLYEVLSEREELKRSSWGVK